MNFFNSCSQQQYPNSYNPLHGPNSIAVKKQGSSRINLSLTSQKLNSKKNKQHMNLSKMPDKNLNRNKSFYANGTAQLFRYSENFDTMNIVKVKEENLENNFYRVCLKQPIGCRANIQSRNRINSGFFGQCLQQPPNLNLLHPIPANPSGLQVHVVPSIHYIYSSKVISQVPSVRFFTQQKLPSQQVVKQPVNEKQNDPVSSIKSIASSTKKKLQEFDHKETESILDEQERLLEQGDHMSFVLEDDEKLFSSNLISALEMMQTEWKAGKGHQIKNLLEKSQVPTNMNSQIFN